MRKRAWTVDRWDARAEWPLGIAAVVFLVAYSWEILDPGLSPQLRAILTAVDYLTWGVFAVDYLVRVMLAQRRWHHITHHLFDLAIVALPLLRPFRLLRLLVLVRFIERTAATSLQGRVAAYVAVSTVLLLYTGSLAVLSAERHAHGANITDFGIALWWGISTITTVGYGDFYPVTLPGRLAAAVMMVGGIALIGVVTATVASWMVQRVSVDPDADRKEQAIETLRSEVATLTKLLNQRIEPATGAASAADVPATASASSAPAPGAASTPDASAPGAASTPDAPSDTTPPQPTPRG